jgi:hypothetical protein
MIQTRQYRIQAFTLVELLVVIGLLALVISFLLPMLNRTRQALVKSQMAADTTVNSTPRNDRIEPVAAPRGPLAEIVSFDAAIALTPRLSVGTVQPESIYEAAVTGSLVAHMPPDSSGEQEIELPLPPQIISLGNLDVTIGGEPTDRLSVRNGKLVWRGTLPAGAAMAMNFVYTSIGRGLYELETPTNSIMDQYKVELTSHGSDLRMMELSMQPTSLSRTREGTRYVWDYKRLMFGRPIALDVLGIAPLDRLGELTWLGPLSVIAFGAILGVVGRAYHRLNLDRWMLVLVLGLFTGAYPLMYFAQEFIPLRAAAISAAAAVLLVIAIRMTTLVGLRLTIFGITLPAAAIMMLVLVAATHPDLQGILLTTLALSMFATGMILAPRLHPPQRIAVAPAI